MSELKTATELTVEHIGRVITAQSGNGPTIKDELVSLWMGTIEYGEERGQTQVLARFKNVSPARDAVNYGSVLSEYFGLNIRTPIIIEDAAA